MKRFLLLILSIVIIQNVTAVEFRCNFGYRLDHGYPCSITKGLIEDINDLPATFVGAHQSGKSDNDLKLISFSGNRHLRLHYFPRGTFEQFPALIDFSLQNCQLRTLTNGDFSGAKNLKNLNLDYNDLRVLNASAFIGADNLNWLSLSGNDMESIHKDAFHASQKIQMLILSQNKLHQLHRDTFSELSELQEILLNSNEFETMTSGLFDRNLKMKRIWLQNNRLRAIEPQLFEPLTNLLLVNLKENACIDEVYRKQYREIESLNNDLTTKCAATKKSSTR